MPAFSEPRDWAGKLEFVDADWLAPKTTCKQFFKTACKKEQVALKKHDIKKFKQLVRVSVQSVDLATKIIEKEFAHNPQAVLQSECASL